MRAYQPSVLVLCGIVLLGAGMARGQEPAFALNGVVKSRDTRMLMPGTTIIATDTLAKDGLGHRVSTLSDRRGKYRLVLPYNGVYIVEYQAQGHVTKRLIVDLMNTRQKDREGGDVMSLQIALFPILGQVDYRAFDQPVAICRFDRKLKKFAWDEEYGKERKGELEAMNRKQEVALRSRTSTAGQPMEPDSSSTQ